MLIITTDLCVYCANPASTRDHIWPRTLLYGSPTVPACRSCNSTTRDKWFDTFEEKAKWLATKATNKGRIQIKVLNELAPLVLVALHQHGAGKNTAPLLAAYRLSGFAKPPTAWATLMKPKQKFKKPKSWWIARGLG